MTDDEKRRQRGELMVEFEDAQAHVAALRVSLKNESDKISTVAEWLNETSRSISVEKLTDEFFSRTMISHVDIVKDKRFRESMNLDRVIDLRSQFIAAQKRVDELACRLREIRASLA